MTKEVYIPILAIDFNELIDPNLVLLSQTDIRLDLEGKPVSLREGLLVKIVMEDEHDYLWAIGKVVPNNTGVFPICKWNCLINDQGIQCMERSK